jgi:hypothetical protein
MFMSNYISTENQTILWKTVQKVPQFNNTALGINREKWFAHIIKYFYEQIQTPKLSVSELKLLNQQTISFMIQELKRIEGMRGSAVLPEQPSSTTNPGLPSYETPQSRLSMYNDQFNARQQEYTNMTKPPVPPIANFSEKIEDDVITNMDELLQQQIKQREYDIAQVKLHPPISPSNSAPGLLQNVNTNVAPASASLVEPVIAKGTLPVATIPIDIQRILEDLKQEMTELRKEVQMLKECRRPVAQIEPDNEYNNEYNNEPSSDANIDSIKVLMSGCIN